MKISRVVVYDSGLDRSKIAIGSVVVVKVETDEGVYGIGELALAYGNGWQAGMYMIKELAEHFLIGQDPSRIEKIWDTIYRGTFWGQGNGGPVLYGAMSAIDIALWDIKGKCLGVPIHELMGGRFFDKVRVYGNGWYKGMKTPAEYGEAAARAVAQSGVTALKFDPIMLTLEGKLCYPSRELERDRMLLAVARVGAVREAVGSGVDILVEIHGNLGTNSAIQLGRRLEEFEPMFYEEPVDSSNAEAMKKVSENVRIPLAAGERLYTRYQFREFIENQSLSIIQPDIGIAGGLTEGKKIVSYADTYHIHFQPHNCGGPVSTAAALALDVSSPNFIIQECFPYFTDDRYSMVDEDYEHKIVDGCIHAPTRPGLGLLLNEQYMLRCASLIAE